MAFLRIALVALVAVNVVHADNFCVLPAKIQQAAAEMTGTLTSPVSANVRPNARSSFSGAVNIVFPQSKG